MNRTHRDKLDDAANPQRTKREEKPLLRELEPGEVDKERPWPGLQAFRDSASAARLFHGRDREKRELLRLIGRDESLVVLHGVSGLGKTSLLRAGCFRVLARAGYFPVYVRFDFTEKPLDLRAQALHTVAAAAAEKKVEAPRFAGEDISLWQYFHQQGSEFWSRLNRLLVPVLVFDQFEEIFTLGRRTPESRQAVDRFLAELTSLINNDPPSALREGWDRLDQPADFEWDSGRVKVVLALREDFLADLDQMRGTLPAVMRNRMRLKPMSGEQALEVVVDPVPGRVDKEVGDRIVRFVGGEKHHMDIDLADLKVEPALLSLLCAKLNDRRLEKGLEKIELGLFEQESDQPLELIIERFYRECFVGLPAESHALIEDRLLTEDGYRGWASYHDLEKAFGDKKPLDTLIERRLLRTEERAGTRGVELIHDVLIRIVQVSRDRRRVSEALEKEAERREQETKGRLEEQRRRLAELQVAREADRARHERELREQAEEQSQRAEELRQRAEEQRRQTEVQSRRAKTWMITAFGLFIVLVLFLFLAAVKNLFEELGRSRHAQRRSDALRLVAESRSASHDSPEIGGFLAYKAHVQATSVADDEQNPLVRLLRGLFGAAESALDRETLLEAENVLRDALDRLPDQVQALHDPNDLSSDGALSGDPSVVAITLADGGRWLLSGSGSGTARLWDLAEIGALPRLKPAAAWRAAEGPLSAVAFGPDGELVAVASGPTVSLWRRQELLAGRHEPESRWSSEEPGEVEPIFQLAIRDEPHWLVEERGLSALGQWVAGRAKGLNLPEAARFQAASADLGWLVATTAGSVYYWRLGADEHSPRTLDPHREVVPLDVGPDRFETDRPGLLVSRLREHGHKALLTALEGAGDREPFEVTEAPDELVYARLSPDLEWLVTGTAYGRVGLWSLAGAVPEDRLTGRLEGTITAAGLSADGNWLAAGSSIGQIGLWERASSGAPRFCGVLNGEDPKIFFGAASQEAIRGLGFLDSEHLYSAAGREIRIGDVDELCRAAAGTTSLIWRSPPGVARAELGISPDERWLAESWKGGAVRLWRLGEAGPAELVTTFGPPRDLESGQLQVIFGPPRWLVTGQAELSRQVLSQVLDRDARLPPIQLFDLGAGAPLVPETLGEPGEQSWLRGAAFDPMGRWLAVAALPEPTQRDGSPESSGDRIWVFDLEADSPARRGELDSLPDHHVETMAFNPAGDRLFAGSGGLAGSGVCSWPIPDALPGHGEPPRACQMITEDPISVTALIVDARDGGLYVGMESGRILRLAVGPAGRPAAPEEIARLSGQISLLALTPDGRFLIASDSLGNAFRLARDGSNEATLFGAVAGKSSRAALCPGGQILALTSAHHTVHVFDALDENPKTTRVVLPGDRSQITAIAPRCKAKELFAATASGIHRFELDTAKLLERAERLQGIAASSAGSSPSLRR